MPVTMICPNLKCGRTVIASDAVRGKVVRCGHCQQLFMVPATAPIPGIKAEPLEEATPPPSKAKKK